MNKQKLISAMETHRKRYSYSCWVIGITNDPNRRKKEHKAERKTVGLWKDWEADSEKIAREVEGYFIEKGMKGATGGGEKPTHVYIF